MAYRMARVFGTSMLPLLRPGRGVLLERVAPGSLLRGDLVAFRLPSGELVVHRLVGRSPRGGLVTRGDNACRNDPAWNPARLEGRVAGFESDSGRWMRPRRGFGRVMGFAARIRPRRLAGRLLHVLAPLAVRPLPRPVLRAASLRRAAAAGPSPAEPAGPSLPSSRPESRFEVQRLGDEYMVFSPSTGDVHALNPLACWIWNQARAGAGVEETLSALALRYPAEDPQTLRRDVSATLRTLAEAGLLDF